MSKTEEIRAVLLQSGLLQAEDGPLLIRIVGSMRLLDLRKGNFLYRKGDRASRLFGLIKGRISLQSTSVDGKELEVREIVAGEIFGAVEVFEFSSRERDALALEDARVFAWERVDILSTLQSCPEMCFGFIRYLCRNNRDQSTHFELLAMHPLSVQLAFHLVRLSQRHQRTAAHSGSILKLSQFDLARKVGAHRQSVNRQLREWEKNGWLKLGRGHIRVLDLPSIKRLLPIELSAHGENTDWFPSGTPPVQTKISALHEPRGNLANQQQTRDVGILAVDAVDYSRHLVKDTAGTLARLRSGLAAIDKAVASGGGRIAAHLGDRVLAEFPTAGPALKAALDLSRQTYGSGRDEDSRHAAMFRISVHYGAVQAVDGVLMGEAINIAVQMTRVARAGGFVFSKQALDNLEGPPKFETQFLGTHDLENVTRPVPVYSAWPLPLAERASLRIKTWIPRRYRRTALAAIAVSAAAVIWLAGEQTGYRHSLDTEWKRSIAVLPFENLDDQDAGKFYADGLSEEIRSLLARIPSLKVTARSSSLLIGQEALDVDGIGRALGVETLLLGALEVNGEQLTVSAQLLDTITGSAIWTERYDTDPNNIFLIQEDMVAAVVKALRLDVSDLPENQPYTANTRAYATYLRARAAYNLFELRTAEALLRQAVDIDPGFARAYELLAATYWRLSGETIEASEGQRLMGEAASMALAIDPDLAFAGALQKAGDVDNWSYLGETEALESAAEELPGHSELLNALSFNLLLMGYIDEALRISRRSLSLDPLSLTAHNRHVDALIASGRFEEAKALLEHAAELGNPYAWWNLGILHCAQRRDETALAYFETYFQATGSEDHAWLERLVQGTRDPATGQAFLDRMISQSVAGAAEEDHYAIRTNLSRWYLYRGFLDPYFDLILGSIDSTKGWSDAETLIQFGVIYRTLGFTAHPHYLKMARLAGFTRAWETRGPPDFCTRVGAQWDCE